MTKELLNKFKMKQRIETNRNRNTTFQTSGIKQEQC